MLALISGSFFAVAAGAVVGSVLELCTAARLLTAQPAAGGAPGAVAGGRAIVDAVVRATDGVLESPLAKHRCVMFSLVLLRRRLHENVGNGALFFNEARPFSLVADGVTFAVDQKKAPIFVLGLSQTEKPLPFLPTAIAGLLVQRFGRKGHLWADEHVVRATESSLDDGAAVHVLVEDGEVKLLSTQPLAGLGRAAFARGAAAVVVAAAAFVGFWLLR